MRLRGMLNSCLVNPPYFFMKFKLRIETYTHGVRISNYTPEMYNIFRSYLRKLILSEPKNVPGGRIIMEEKKKYFGETSDQKEVYIHRYCLEDFLLHLEQNHIYKEQIEFMQVPVPLALPAEYVLFEKYVLRDYQETIKIDILRPIQSARVDLFTGYGKAVSNITPVKVPGGWKPMGDIRLGDMVTGRDGNPTAVTGVYPQGRIPLYRITFQDGRTAEACAEHQWSVYHTHAKPGTQWKTLSTAEMLRIIDKKGQRVYVPLCESENVPDIELPIPPYTLGVILGDGHIGEKGTFITNGDADVWNRIIEEMPSGMMLGDTSGETTKRFGRNIDKSKINIYREALKNLGLLGARSNSKFIPDIYLNGSTTQREALLQGLMDTDGTVSVPTLKCSSGSITYTSVSIMLAKGVQYLVRSLGNHAKLYHRATPTYTYKGVKKNGQDAYNVNIRAKRPTQMFSLGRKLARLNDNHQYAAGLKLKVMAIEGIGSYEATCISVDNDDKLFVINDFIVTHNTLTSLATIAEMNCKFTVTIPPKYFGLWTKALDETYRSVQGRYMTISGSAALQNLIDRALDNDLDGIDIFIISNITYRTFIEAFELHGDKLSDIGYNVPPTRFHELLGVGCQINDEIQEDPGLLFRTDIFTNIAKQIYLSATPFTGNAYVTKMIDKMLPPETAVRLPDYKVYIKCLGLVYNEIGIKPKHYLTPFKNTYNHARYETQMLLNSKRHATYLRMVRKIAEGVYVNDRLEGQKLLILCATVAFIKDMVEYLRDQFPDLEVNEHVAGCPYERLLTNDITVSTIKSSGTGVDIPNLREVVLLQATGSEKDMIQILGRLRPLKLYPDVSPRLTYMICENIPHHIRYSGNTQTIFKDRTSESSIKRISVN